MQQPDFTSLDRNVARARILLSLLAMLSLYIDPTVAGGLFHLSALALAILLCHLGYSLVLYIALSRRAAVRGLPALSAALDLFFATAIAFLTEGQTSPSYVFFVFAIIAVGIRAGLRRTIEVTLCGVGLYLLVIAASERMTGFYLMRAVYLAIAGYLIGFVGQQRGDFETRMHELELNAERHSIARSLHDGYVQALAGVNLKLEACRELLMRGRTAQAAEQIGELQHAVAREYDEVREYLRSLAGLRAPARPPVPAAISDPRLDLRADFSVAGAAGEHILQIMLEGLRNSRRHSMAGAIRIAASQSRGKVRITIQDDGIGFPSAGHPPWAIASRVSESGGSLVLSRNGSAGLAIELPDK